MSKERENVKCKTELEFITEVADDCVANLKDKDREHLIRNPYAIDYHFHIVYISEIITYITEISLTWIFGLSLMICHLKLLE